MTPPPIPPLIDPLKGKSVKYSLTRGDILRWHLRILIRNRVLIALGLIVSLFIVWKDLHDPALASQSTGFKILYAVFYTVAIFGFVGGATMLMMLLMVMGKKYRGLIGSHELQIHDDGLVERSDFNESLHRWTGFHKVISTKRYLYIYVTDNIVHIVPRRFFSSEQEERTFRDELERRMKSGQMPVMPPSTPPAPLSG
jgi:hypothetical protein